MIKLIQATQVSELYKDTNNKYKVIPVALDNLTDNDIFKYHCNLYPELHEAFTNLPHKEYVVGEYIKLVMNNGDNVYVAIIKKVDKYQAYLFDVTKVLSNIMDTIPEGGGVIIPNITKETTKLHEAIMIPTIIDHIERNGITIYFTITDSTFTDIVESISDDGIIWKQDSWKSDWMLHDDDIVFVEILHELNHMLHGFKLSKSKLIKCYKVCYDAGMFPKFEFYTTDYGEYFKMFMPKYSSLLNHGLLMNTQHYAKVVEGVPARTDLRIGYVFPHLKRLAHTNLAHKRSMILSIADKMKSDYRAQQKITYAQYNENKSDTSSTSYSTNYSSNGNATNPFKI